MRFARSAIIFFPWPFVALVCFLCVKHFALSAGRHAVREPRGFPDALPGAQSRRERCSVNVSNAAS
jgi:uncharacterized MAPEG superfamily protein